MNPSQLFVLKFAAKMLLGLLALQMGMALTAYIYIFARPSLGHWPAFGIGAVFLVVWFGTVTVWMGRQYSEWYNR